MQPNKRQTLVYSCNTSNVALSSIDCIDNYLIDRESEIITERLIKSFDNELLNFHDNSKPSIGIDNYMTSQDFVETLYNPDVLNIELDTREDERVVKLPSSEQQWRTPVVNDTISNINIHNNNDDINHLLPIRDDDIGPSNLDGPHLITSTPDDLETEYARQRTQVYAYSV